MFKSMMEKSAQKVFQWASKVDTRKVIKNVAKLQKDMPGATTDEMIDALIKAKAKRTATVGVVTSVAGAIPVLGTAISLTAGMVADLGATITSQAELVLEIAEVLNVPMTEAEKREAVFVVMGIGAGAQHVGNRVGRNLLGKLGQRYAKRWVGKVIPFVGLLAAGGINYVSTYLIGKRAKAYFVEGSEAMGNWQESMKNITDVDKEKLSQWMNQSKDQVSAQLVALGQNIQGLAETASEKIAGKTSHTTDVEDVLPEDIPENAVNQTADDTTAKQ